MARKKRGDNAEPMDGSQEADKPTSTNACQTRRKIEELLERKRYREEQVFTNYEYEFE